MNHKLTKMYYKLLLLIVAFSLQLSVLADDIKQVNVQNNNIAEIPCPEDINLLPMYGKVAKCKQQLESDAKYVEMIFAEQSDTLVASMGVLESGWMFLHRKEYDTAMKRFNQAWLIDPSNTLVYLSFVVLQDLKGDVTDSKRLLDESLIEINKIEQPKKLRHQEMTRGLLCTFCVDNAVFAYKKTDNAELIKYLYTKLDTMRITDSEKETLQTKLEEALPSLVDQKK